MSGDDKLLKNRAFTLIEVLVVIGVIALLVAILLPVLAAVRERGRRTVCLSNVRQINAALMMYVQDADGFFPVAPEDGAEDSPTWDDGLLPYAHNAAVFRCPDCLIPPIMAAGPSQPVAQGYAFNTALSGATVGPRSPTSEVTVPFPATTVSFCETSFRTGTVPNEPGATTVSRELTTDAPDTGDDLSPGETVVGPPGAVRHQGGSDYGFADGHARWYRPTQVSAAEEEVNGVAQTNNGSAPTFAR